MTAVGATQGLYLHVLVKHVPDQIRMFGDLNTRQTQGLEHCHYCRKQVGLHATNRKPGQRLATMLAFSLLKRSAMIQDETLMCAGKEELLRHYKAEHAQRCLSKLQRTDATLTKLEEEFSSR